MKTQQVEVCAGRKLVLCLALVLSGALAGCSSVRTGTSVQSQREGELFSNLEAVCLKSDGSSRLWTLKWALTEDTWNIGELFLTVHERQNRLSPEYDPDSTAAIYVKVGNKLKFLKRLDAGRSYFLKPNVIWAAPKGEDREQLIQITEVFYGTGHITREHIFTTVVMPVSDLKFTPDLKLDEVEFIPAWESFKEHFGKDEGLWKGAWSTLGDDGLSFEFLVLKKDPDDFRPVYKVIGSYKLERKPGGGLRISMDSCQREPVKDEDWH